METKEQAINELKAVFTFPEDNRKANQRPISGFIDDNGCLICTSHKTKDGKYPRAQRNNKDWRLHRYIFTKWCEEIPEGEVVRHKCDNTMCINPDHLERGTPQDNVNDRTIRGRQPVGSACKNSKLTEEKVYEIRFISPLSIKELAEKYDVTCKTIRDIKNWKTWKHVTKDMFAISEAA